MVDPFMSYPQLIHLLMDRAFRDEQLARINPKMLAGSALADGIAREYTLNEIAIITRAGPARLLGLAKQGTPWGRRRRGHHDLRPGCESVADVRDPTLRTQKRDAGRGRGAAPTCAAGTAPFRQARLRHAVERDIKQYFDRYLSVAFENYGA